VASVVVAGGYLLFFRGRSATPANAQEASPETTPVTNVVRVDVTRPRKTNMDRTTGALPCSVQSDKFAQLFAEVSGYLKTQTVDIGDHVKRGQVLATIDVPELEKQVQRNKAGVAQADARVGQMKARVASASADWEAAQAEVVHAEANAKSAEAWRRLREKQWGRMKDLFALKSIDERLVDEAQEHFEAAMETVRSAHAAIALAKAKLAAAAAKIQQAEADVREAEAQVGVAQADLEKSQVLVRFATITSPYDGIITQRSQFPGDFVRAATGGSSHVPLLTVERTDKMRVVVMVPDRDAPYADPGDTALVEVDALPGKKFDAKISRIEGAEDPQTRLMRVEIDVPNPLGKLRRGMYGRVTIVLEKSADVLTIPTSSLVSRTPDGKAVVFVVRDGCARRVRVQIGGDNGIRVAVLNGLKATDQVIRHPPSDLADGAAVSVGSSEALAKARTGG
jgi:RND family efflux transporter MFP subunit